MALKTMNFDEVNIGRARVGNLEIGGRDFQAIVNDAANDVLFKVVIGAGILGALYIGYRLLR